MRPTLRVIVLLLSSAGVASSMAGCATGYVTYDPYYHDYHRWDAGEDRLYWQWTVATHRPHVVYERLGLTDQRAYWGWRHRR